MTRNISKEEFEEGLAKRIQFYKEFSIQRFEAAAPEYVSYIPIENKTFSVHDFDKMNFHMRKIEYLSDSTNHINMLINLKFKLSAWVNVLEECKSSDDHFEIYEHFVREPSYLALLMPKAAREKFIYYFCHLSNQTRRIINGPKEDLLGIDESIKEKVAEKYEKDSEACSQFYDSILTISADEMVRMTNNFRNGFSHQVTPGIEYGLTGFSSRAIFKNQGEYNRVFGNPKSIPEEIRPPSIKNKEKRIVNGFGSTEPLALRDVVDVLDLEIKKIKLCNDNFRKFIFDCEERMDDI